MPAEFLIIDAYNVMQTAGFSRGQFVPGRLGPGSLQRARQTFLNFLGQSLPDELRQRTTVVFDAKSAPEGLPDREIINDLEVLFAVQFAEADEMIEYLIKRHSAPKQLTVVSSDHRIQTAARRKNAHFVDSDRWIDELQQATESRYESDREEDEALGSQGLSAEETTRWLEEFNLGDAEDLTPPPEPPTEIEELPDQDPAESGYGPFPPGYGDDLLDESGYWDQEDA